MVGRWEKHLKGGGDGRTQEVGKGEENEEVGVEKGMGGQVKGGARNNQH